MRKIFVAGLILLAIVGSAIAEPGHGNGNGQSGQADPGNSGNAPGQQTGDNSGQGQGGNPDAGNNGQGNDGAQGNAGQGEDDQGDVGGDDQSGDTNDSGDEDQGGDDQGDDSEGDQAEDDQEENNPAEDDLVNDLIHDDIPHDEELLRIALRELAHPAPGPTCRLVMTANLTRAVIKNECAAPADIGSMVLSQEEHIVIGETPEGRYILGPGQSYEIPIEAHVGTLRLTGIGGYGEYAVCEVTA